MLDKYNVKCICSKYYVNLKNNNNKFQVEAVNPKGNQHWAFTGRIEAPILWPPDAKSRLVGKDPGARKDWRQKEKGVAEDEIVGQHHQLNGHEFEQTLRTVEDRWAWHASVHGIAKTQTWLSNQTTITTGAVHHVVGDTNKPV